MRLFLCYAPIMTTSTKMTDLDRAVKLMKTALELYYSGRRQNGKTDVEGLRKMFAGEKLMLEALLGREAKEEALRQLRQSGLKIPHSGDRIQGRLTGWDSDADMDFEK